MKKISLLLFISFIFAIVNLSHADEVKFDKGATIHVCYRTYLTGSNPFTIESAFKCTQTLAANQGPSGGGVTGELIINAIKKETALSEFKSIWAHTVKVEKPFKSGGRIGIGVGTSGFFNNYVFKDSSGQLKMFIDIETSK